MTTSNHPFAFDVHGHQVALGRPRSSVLDDPRTLRRFALRQFIDKPALPPLMDRITRPSGYQPRMFANDRLGDCTCAGLANYALLAAAKAGQQPPNITDDDVIARYSAVSGYRPSDPSTDQGAIELDVLNGWRRDPFAGSRLVAFAAIDVHDTELLRYAVQLFGAAYVGIALPTTAQSQIGHVWDVTPGMVAGSWGGHCVILSAYDWSLGVPLLRCDTWGADQALSEAFWRACGDEAYAPLTDQWRNVPGLDYAALSVELGQLGQVAGGGERIF